MPESSNSRIATGTVVRIPRNAERRSSWRLFYALKPREADDRLSQILYEEFERAAIPVSVPPGG